MVRLKNVAPHGLEDVIHAMGAIIRKTALSGAVTVKCNNAVYTPKKVALISPLQNNPEMIGPSPGLGYLAGSLLAAGHEVEIIDCLRDGITNEPLGNILSEKRPDMVGITVESFDYPHVCEANWLSRGFW